LSITRGPGTDRVYCLAHFADTPREIRAPVEAGSWRKILDSSSPKWGGPGESSADSIESDGAEVMLRLAAYNFLLYQTGGKHHTSVSS